MGAIGVAWISNIEGLVFYTFDNFLSLKYTYVSYLIFVTKFLNRNFWDLCTLIYQIECDILLNVSFEVVFVQLVCMNYEVTPKLVFRCVVNFGGVTEWHQSISYSELGRFQNLNYNLFSKFLSLSPLFDILARLLPGNLYALFCIYTSII